MSWLIVGILAFTLRFVGLTPGIVSFAGRPSRKTKARQTA
jgi:hypothetical protein